MSYFVKATIDGHTLSAKVATAKEAFAKAIEWQVARQLEEVTISDGRDDYSITEFSEVMAHSEIAATRGNC